MRSVFETEAAETPALAARQFARLARELPALIVRLDQLAPALVATIARGSSDHAAAFAGYLFGLLLNLPMASVPPSIASVYGRSLRLDKALVLAISQSGASPDICAAAASAKAAGAFTLGLINVPESPLGQTVDARIEIGAGTEGAVAASKSFMLTLTALVHLAAVWSRNPILLRALESLPDVLKKCAGVDWSAAVRLLAGAEQVFVVGRGLGLPVAREFALKLKEVCGIHAEAVSAAEILHGPIAIASPTLPAIVLAGEGPVRASVDAAAAKLRAAGAPVVLVGSAPGSAQKTDAAVVIPSSADPLLKPLVAAQAAYPFFAALARARGRNPDCPPHLLKVTRTV
jgi:glutamine---fructose-6-phosphate transaminase (isomerizing)